MNSPKPHIAILHYAAPPTIGGVESTIAVHARLLADHGYPVKIIAGRGEPFDSRVPVEIIPTIDSKHSFVTQVNQKLARGYVPNDLAPLTIALSHILTGVLQDIDICIAHNVLTLHKNLALTTALYEMVRARSVRLIAWCHDFAWTDPVYANELHAGLPWDLLRHIWADVKYVAVSEARQRELARLLDLDERKIAVVPPGIDACDFFGVTETTVHWIREFKLLDAAPLLLLPARVTRRKNIELAIEITGALRDVGHNPKLIIMGPLGPHNPANRDYLDELLALRRQCGVEEAVIFLQDEGDAGVDNASRRDLYALADALLFTSEREGFGIPILEAGLARLPIFCSDLAPFRESAHDYAHFFALDESPQSIAARLGEFLDQDTRYQMKQRVLKEYTWERIFEERMEPLLGNVRTA